MDVTEIVEYIFSSECNEDEIAVIIDAIKGCRSANRELNRVKAKAELSVGMEVVLFNLKRYNDVEGTILRIKRAKVEVEITKATVLYPNIVGKTFTVPITCLKPTPTNLSLHNFLENK